MLTLAAAKASIDHEIRDVRSRLDQGGDALWSLPTRLSGWTVGDLAAHLAWGQALQADAWRRIVARDGSAVGAPDRSGARAAVLKALGDAASELQHALGAAAEDDLSAVATMPYGPVPAALLLQIAAIEAGVHGSDVRAATGDSDALSDATIDAAFTFMNVMLPLLAAPAPGVDDTTVISIAPAGASALAVTYDGTTWSVGPGVEAATATIEGPAGELALYLFGRRPAEEAEHNGVQFLGDEELGRRIKELFPGP